ncbi:hypothetical protein BDQ17DRAFT_1434794 [Cyathus striatus]|nr:hypothetical protein BDQ17DRAFT_1434794 [Cyathus striatus]
MTTPTTMGMFSNLSWKTDLKPLSHWKDTPRICSREWISDRTIIQNLLADINNFQRQEAARERAGRFRLDQEPAEEGTQQQELQQKRSRSPESVSINSSAFTKEIQHIGKNSNKRHQIYEEDMPWYDDEDDQFIFHHPDLIKTQKAL